MIPLELNSQIITAQLKESVRECKEHLLPWLEVKQNQPVIKSELKRLINQLPLWSKVDRNGRMVYQHKVTKIAIDLQDHRLRELSPDQANKVVVEISKHVNILGNSILGIKSDWGEPINYEQAFKNYKIFHNNSN